MYKQIIGHCSFVGHTGYAEHAREFFTALNKLLPVKIHNYAYCDDLSYLTDEQRDMLILMPDGNHSWGTNKFLQTDDQNILNIVLLEANHYYFYDTYKSPTIFYTVWELPRYPKQFFEKLKECDRLWLPTNCHKQWAIEQGYSSDKIDVVHEGVDGNVFYPGKPYDDRFRFLFFGRWDDRKNLIDTIKAFLVADLDADLILSADNSFSVDGLNSTEERLEHYGLIDDRIKVVHFPPFFDYVNYLRGGHVFLSASFCEGWHLPLIQSMACGIPVIATNYGPPLEYANGVAHLIDVKKHEKPSSMFNVNLDEDLGTWSVPDFDDLVDVIRDVYEKYNTYKDEAVEHSVKIRKNFSWEKAADTAYSHIKELSNKSIVPRSPITEIKENLNYSSTAQAESGMELYQDQWINGEVVKKGKVDCEGRYAALKKMFDFYKKPFTLLDIGSNFGYYSIRAAEDYDAICILVESEDEESKKLLELISKSDKRDNFIVLKNRIKLDELMELSTCEYFDVVLALNVIHHFPNSTTEVCDTFMKLGDNLIVESPSVDDKGACGQNNLQTIKDYFDKQDTEKLGTFSRHTSKAQADMLWVKTTKKELTKTYYGWDNLLDVVDPKLHHLLKKQPLQIHSTWDKKTVYNNRQGTLTDWINGINLKTFIVLGGIYPDQKNIIDDVKNKRITTGYKFDDTSTDLVLHNFILKGTKLNLIDYHDEYTNETSALTDDECINSVIDGIKGNVVDKHAYNFKDIVGNKYNRLKVLEYAYTKNKRAYWKCLCDCGNEVVVNGKNLRNGLTQSCGCYRIDRAKEYNSIDEVGNKYGRLYVDSYSHTEKHMLYWNCTCDCGNEIITAGSYLRSGDVKSCGCLQKEMASKANSGKILSDETRKKISENHADFSGENSPNWKGGITPGRQKCEGSKEYKRWRQEVYDRDNYTCQRCGDDKGGNLNAHHLFGFTPFPDFRLSVWNGITLCKDCHKWVHMKINTEKLFIRDKVRLNLGSGNDLLPYFINIDSSNGNADESWDIINMPISDGIADEVLISHVLEHFKVNVVPDMLKEINRVLKINGKVEIRVPNLTQVVINWQNAEDQWANLIYELYGSQDYNDNCHFSGFTQSTLQEVVGAYGFNIDSCNIDGLQLILNATKIDDVTQDNIVVDYNFIDGAYVKINSGDNKYYSVLLTDDTGNHIHSTVIKSNWYTRTNRKYYTDWNIEVSNGSNILFTRRIDLEGKRVLIELSSKSLGDTLSWAPYIEEFRKKHNCEIFCTSFFNDILDYPNITFMNPGDTYTNIHASYVIGCFDDDTDRNKNNWQTIYLQQIATDCLGLEYKEIRPQLKDVGTEMDMDVKLPDKYVVIAPHSTMQAKYWLDDRWNKIIEYLHKLGYDTVSLSKEPNRLANTIYVTNPSIEDAMRVIKRSEFTMSIGNGLAWLSFALNKPNILISGFSDYCEFKDGCYRIVPIKGCHGCFNNTSIKFDRGDWDWCENAKRGGKPFECAYNISVDVVRDAINLLIKDNING